MTLLTGFGLEEHFIDALLGRYRARRGDARGFALTHRVLLLQADNGAGIDIALGALPFEESAVRRSRLVAFAEEIGLRVGSPDDLIVIKAFAGREQDWLDVRMTIVRQGAEALDWNYVQHHLAPLAEAKGEPGILRKLADLRERHQ